MKIFIAGATGAIGSRLVPLLAAAGHDVIGTSRTPAGAQRVDTAGGTGVVMDALDPDSVHREILDARPDVVVLELTALGDGIDLKHLDQAFARTNELRTRGTDLLLSAADEAGVGRVLVQSFTGWPNARTGAAVKTEEDPLDPTPIAGSRGTHSALAHAEEATFAAGGLVLRYGPLYGPGQAIGEGGEMLSLVRDRGDARPFRALQHRRRRAGGGRRMAAGARAHRRCETSAARPRVGRPTDDRSLRGHMDDRQPRLVQREGEGAPGVVSPVLELARGLLLRARCPGDVRRNEEVRRNRALRLTTPHNAKTPGILPGVSVCARYWDRTSDLFRVREARYRCANRAQVGCSVVR